MNEVKAKPAWEFTAITMGEVAGTLTVHRGTGHWSNLFNRETGEIGEGVYIYEATWRGEDGETVKTCIRKATLLHLRKHAKPEAAR